MHSLQHWNCFDLTSQAAVSSTSTPTGTLAGLAAANERKRKQDDSSSPPMDALRIYSASKLAMTVFTEELCRRLPLGASSVRAVSANPGSTQPDSQNLIQV